MRSFPIAALAFCLLLPLSAIDSKAEEKEDVKPVSWWQYPANKDALEAKLAQCKENPGELRDTPNCVNARQAFSNNFTGEKFDKVKDPTYGFGK